MLYPGELRALTLEPTMTTSTSTQTPTLRKGARVTITGLGRTARWPGTLIGTVTRVSRGRVYVRWDGTRILAEDDMDAAEVARA